MKSFVIRVAALACIAAPAYCQSVVGSNPGTWKSAASNTNAAKRIAAAEAEQHYDELVAVTGKVAQVNFRPNIVYLNFEKPYPSNLFTAIIFSKATNEFGDLSKLADMEVEVTGKIVKFRAKPEVVLANSNQLKIIRQKADPDKPGKK